MIWETFKKAAPEFAALGEARFKSRGNQQITNLSLSILDTIERYRLISSSLLYR